MPEYPYVAFALQIGTWSIAEDALADTGYDGGLIIPVEAVEGILRLPKRVELHMPDGRVH